MIIPILSVEKDRGSMSFSRLNNLGLAEPDLQHKSSGSQVRVLPLHQGYSNCVLRKLLCGLLKGVLQKSKTGMTQLIQNSLRKNKSLAFFFFYFMCWETGYISIWTRMMGGKKRENHHSYRTHIALKWLGSVSVVIMVVHYFFPVLITDLISLRRRKANYSKQKCHYHP